MFKMVPKVGIEPTRYRYRWILSPVRLPISPLGQRDYYIHYLKLWKYYLVTNFLKATIMTGIAAKAIQAK